MPPLFLLFLQSELPQKHNVLVISTFKNSISMNKSWMLGAALLSLTLLGGATAQTPAQDRKDRKAARVTTDKAAIANDKANLNVLREEKADDKMLGDKPAVQADRKAIRKTERRLLKHRVRRDVDKVKKAL
jgi:hypothetical protein